MNYYNEKLNIKITNFEETIYKIKEDEKEGCIKLYRNDVLCFYICRNAEIELCEDNSIKLYGKSSAKLYGKSSAKLYDDSSAELWDNSFAELYDNSSAILRSNSFAYLYENSYAELGSNSSTKLHDNSSAKLYENSYAYLYDNSSAELWDNSFAELYDFSTSTKKSSSCEIKTGDNFFGEIIEYRAIFIAPQDMVVYKKIETINGSAICKLRIDKGQKFQSENHNKCRTNKAFVLDIYNPKTNEKYKGGYSSYDNTFIYIVGEYVYPNSYDENINECSNGIHFFLMEREAIKY